MGANPLDWRVLSVSQALCVDAISEPVAPCLYALYQSAADMMLPMRGVGDGDRADPGGQRCGSPGQLAGGQRALRDDDAGPPSPTAARPSASTRSRSATRSCRCTRKRCFATPFGTLLRFAKAGVPPQPRVLLVAPLSGHFATLLRDTVRVLLPEHDVYITDWANARDVGLLERPLRLRRICRASDQVPRGDGPGRPCHRGVPALRADAGGGGDHGRGRQSRPSRAA